MNNKVNFIKNYFDKEDNFFITMINHSNGQTRNYFHNIFSFEKYVKKIEELNKDNSIYFSFSVVAVLSSILFLLNWINNCKDLIYEDYKFFFKVILLSIVFAILIDSFKHEIHKKETKVSIVKEIG